MTMRNYYESPKNLSFHQDPVAMAVNRSKNINKYQDGGFVPEESDNEEYGSYYPNSHRLRLMVVTPEGNYAPGEEQNPYMLDEMEITPYSHIPGMSKYNPYNLDEVVVTPKGNYVPSNMAQAAAGLMAAPAASMLAGGALSSLAKQYNVHPGLLQKGLEALNKGINPLSISDLPAFKNAMNNIMESGLHEAQHYIKPNFPKFEHERPHNIANPNGRPEIYEIKDNPELMEKWYPGTY